MQEIFQNSEEKDSKELAYILLDEAHKILEDDIKINRKMGSFGADLLPEKANILTHCNAGALATAGHGTALGGYKVSC